MSASTRRCHHDGDGNSDSGHPPLPALVSTGVTAATLLVAFGLLALGVEAFWVAFPVGFGGVLPAAVGAAKYRQATGGGPNPAGDERDRTAPDEADPLATLRRRYARGELTDAEFERGVERLLATGDTEPSRREDPLEH